jgi:hypothetical protein
MLGCHQEMSSLRVSDASSLSPRLSGRSALRAPRQSPRRRFGGDVYRVAGQRFRSWAPQDEGAESVSLPRHSLRRRSSRAGVRGLGDLFRTSTRCSRLKRSFFLVGQSWWCCSGGSRSLAHVPEYRRVSGSDEPPLLSYVYLTYFGSRTSVQHYFLRQLLAGVLVYLCRCARLFRTTRTFLLVAGTIGSTRFSTPASISHAGFFIPLMRHTPDSCMWRSLTRTVSPRGIVAALAGRWRARALATPACPRSVRSSLTSGLPDELARGIEKNFARTPSAKRTAPRKKTSGTTGCAIVCGQRQNTSVRGRIDTHFIDRSTFTVVPGQPHRRSPGVGVMRFRGCNIRNGAAD